MQPQCAATPTPLRRFSATPKRVLARLPLLLLPAVLAALLLPSVDAAEFDQTCSFGGGGGGDYTVTLLVTRAVEGAVHAVDTRGTPQTYDDAQCASAGGPACPSADACVGGAARRQTVLERARGDPNAVALDTGAHFFGSALFFPTFRGNASASLFRDAGYDAFALSWRDFTAGVTPADPGGAALLAAYLGTAGGGSKRATITNLELPAGDPLAPFVRRHALVPLGGGRSLAFLALCDPTHVLPLNARYGARLVGYQRAVARELAALRRDGGGRLPDVVVVAIGDPPTAPDGAGFEDGAASREDARALFQRDFVARSIGVHVVLVAGGTGGGEAEAAPECLLNWAGDRVLVVPDTQSGGVVVDNVTVSFDAATGQVAAFAREKIALGCAVPPHAGTQARVAGYLEEMDAVLGVVVGTATSSADGNKVAGPFAPDAVADAAGTFVPADAVAGAGEVWTGCRVAECAAGNLIAARRDSAEDFL